MINWINNIFGNFQLFNRKTTLQSTARERLYYEKLPPLIYAIGDVHGRLDLLEELEEKISKDIKKEKKDALIIMLGDYIDRGLDSSLLIDHLLSPPPPSSTRLCLAGNHEEAMLAFIENPKNHTNWLDFGGYETLLSYGFSRNDLNRNEIKKRGFIHRINSYIPDEHRDFLKQLPIVAVFPEYLFVHAGVRADVTLEEQSDYDLLWIRKEFLDHYDNDKWRGCWDREQSDQRRLKEERQGRSTYDKASTDKQEQPAQREQLEELTIVHGHTPVKEVFISPFRINVDTSAYLTNNLSAIKIVNGEIAGTLSTSNN